MNCTEPKGDALSAILAAAPDGYLAGYTSSFPLDAQLLDLELWSVAAHIVALLKAGLVPPEHGSSVLRLLRYAATNQDAQRAILASGDEDIHLNLELWIVRQLGLQVGGDLFLGRSRNAAVNVVLRMALRDQTLAIAQQLSSLIGQLLNRAAKHVCDSMVGETHDQPAQPISLGFWLHAHAVALLRVLEDSAGVLKGLDVYTGLSGAIAGTSVPANGEELSRSLGFSSVTQNALDATGSHDFALKYLWWLACSSQALARYCLEIIRFSSPQRGFAHLSANVAMGSSLMPQKRNPSALEIIRARCCEAYGRLAAALTNTHSLGLGYHRDYQVLKELYLTGAQQHLGCLQALSHILSEVTFDTRVMLDDARRYNISSAEIATRLRMETQSSYRQCYWAVNQALRGLDASDVDRTREGLSILFAAHGVPPERLDTLLDPNQHLRVYSSQGSSNPEETTKCISVAMERLQQRDADLAKMRDGLKDASRRTWAEVSGWCNVKH